VFLIENTQISDVENSPKLVRKLEKKRKIVKVQFTMNLINAMMQFSQ